IFAGAVGIPVRGVHQFAEGAGVTFPEQIAGLLPPEDVPRRHAPRRAMIGLVASQKVEEQVGVHEAPAFSLAQAENPAEQLLGLAPAEKVILIGGALIGVTRRDRNSDAEILGIIEKGGDILRRVPVID